MASIICIRKTDCESTGSRWLNPMQREIALGEDVVRLDARLSGVHAMHSRESSRRVDHDETQ